MQEVQAHSEAKGKTYEKAILYRRRQCTLTDSPALWRVLRQPAIASAHSTSTTPTTSQAQATDKHADHPLREFTRNHSDQIVDQIAPQLHLSSAQLTQKLQSSERLVKIVKEQGVSLTSLRSIIINSVDNVVAQALSAKNIDQQHADVIKDLVQQHPFVVAHVLHCHYSSK
jgi:hypothetical protein